MYQINCRNLKQFSGVMIHNDDLLICSSDENSAELFNMNSGFWTRAFAEDRVFASFLKGYVLDVNLGRLNDAVKWYRAAADEGLPIAMYYMFMCYFTGTESEVSSNPLLPQNDREAIAWLFKSAEAGHPSSMVKLATLYDRGLGVPHDPAKAAYYYEAAAELEHPYGQLYLANAYMTGEGVTRNVEKAKYWYKRAADNGNRRALQWCKQNGVPCQAPDLLTSALISAYEIAVEDQAES